MIQPMWDILESLRPAESDPHLQKRTPVYMPRRRRISDLMNIILGLERKVIRKDREIEFMKNKYSFFIDHILSEKKK